jgi:type I restriction enzyme S subunit
MSRWPKKKLYEIAHIIMGQSPPGETYNTTGEGLPFFQGKGEFGDAYPTPAKWCSAPHKIADPGDILLSVRAPVGPTNIAQVKSCIGRGLAAIRAHEGEMIPSFLRHFLKSVEQSISQMGVGSTFNAISKADIENFEVPAPPLSDQLRIVRILDEAEQLRCLRAEADGRTSDLIPALFYDMFGDPATNPKHWPPGVLGDVIHGAKDGPHVSPTYSNSGIPFLSTRNIRPGRIIWDDMKYISVEEAHLHWKKCKPEFGDVLYTKGGTTGLAKAVDFATEVAVWVHIAVLKTNHDRVVPEWLEYMLNSQFCYTQSQQLTHGIANRDLGLTRMVGIKVYLPPLSSQREFADRVAAIRAMEGEQGTGRKQLDDLFQSLLHRAFQGEL